MAAPLNILTPTASSNWAVGQQYDITWENPTLGFDTVRINLLKGGQFLQTIVTNIANDGSYSWTVPFGLFTDSDYAIQLIESEL